MRVKCMLLTELGVRLHRVSFVKSSFTARFNSHIQDISSGALNLFVRILKDLAITQQKQD